MRYKYTYRTTARDLWQLPCIIYTVRWQDFVISYLQWRHLLGILQVGPGPGDREVSHCAGVLPFYSYPAAYDLCQGKEAGGGNYPGHPGSIDDSGLHSGWAMTRRSCRGSR